MSKGKLNDHERSDAKALPLLISAGVLAAGVAVVLVLMVLMLKGMIHVSDSRKSPPHARFEKSAEVPEPRLQITPMKDIADIVKDETYLSSTYGWVSFDAKVVRIPVDRAMELLVDDPLPSRGGKQRL
jgi:hypothetical protein